MPSEFSKALRVWAGLAGQAGGGSGLEPGGSTPSWLTATSAGSASAADTEPGEKIATDGWFDSNLPPAALQPEAAIVRGSDSDPDSTLAHQGLTAAALASAASSAGSAGSAGVTGSAGSISPATASALPTGTTDGTEPPSTAQVRPAEDS